MTQPTYKTCCSCRQSRPLAEFHAFYRSPDGRQSKCKACCAAYQRAYNERRGAERAERRRAQYEANRERDLAARRAWVAANPEKHAEIRLRRRARKRRAASGPVDLDALWTGDCGICGSPMDRALAYPDPSSKSIDHIISLAGGGTHSQENLQWAHLICNMRKGAR